MVEAGSADPPFWGPRLFSARAQTAHPKPGGPRYPVLAVGYGAASQVR